MTENQYWHRVNETSRYGALLAQGGLITHQEAIGYTFELLGRLLSIRLMEIARRRRDDPRTAQGT